MFVPVFVLFLVLAALAVWIGYLRYKSRVSREAVAAQPQWKTVPPAALDGYADEMSRLNQEMRDLLGQSRRAVESMRESLARGLKG